ncbi:MAG: hypothetical protein R2875_12285 [Desulfobacterales bacterium]
MSSGKRQNPEAALTVMPEDVANELAGLPEDHMHCAALAVNTLGRPLIIIRKFSRENRKRPLTLMPPRFQ